MVAADGAEIGRAQAMQAPAARVEPEAAMNPVLLKPGSDRRSQVVRAGAGRSAEVDGDWATGASRPRCASTALAALDDLRVALRRRDLRGRGQPGRDQPARPATSPTWGWPGARGLPVVVVGDIDRGGVFAALFGTLALLRAARPGAGRAGSSSTSSAATPRLLAPGPATAAAS